MQPSTSTPPNRKRLGLIIAIIVACFIGFASSIHGDCGWNTSVLSWVDENGNGTWDTDEPPLEGVQFHVNDTLNDYKDVGNRSISDWNGRSNVSVLLPGCPSARFEVYAVPPIGYQSITNKSVQITGLGANRKRIV